MDQSIVFIDQFLSIRGAFPYTLYRMDKHCEEFHVTMRNTIFVLYSSQNETYLRNKNNSSLYK